MVYSCTKFCENILNGFRVMTGQNINTDNYKGGYNSVNIVHRVIVLVP